MPTLHATVITGPQSPVECFSLYSCVCHCLLLFPCVCVWCVCVCVCVCVSVCGNIDMHTLNILSNYIHTHTNITHILVYVYNNTHNILCIAVYEHALVYAKYIELFRFHAHTMAAQC